MLFYRYLFYGLVGVAVLQSVFYYPQLPPTLASHFDGAGSPDGWSGRTAFFATYLGIMALLVIVFDCLPRRSGQHDKLRINLPNRDYWLAPERRSATLEYLQRRLMVLGIAHQLLAIYTIQLAIIANLRRAPLDTSIYWALGLYFLFLAAWLLRLFLHFRQP